VFTLLLTILLGAPAAYAIEKLRFRGNTKVMAFFLLGIMIPIFVSLLPMFQIYNALGLRNTYLSLVLPQVGFSLPLCIYLYCGFMRYVPNSLMESAYLDGAGPFLVFRKIIFPMSRNTTITIITFNFIFIWNEFTFANTFMTSSRMKTLPLGLNDFVGLYGYTDWGATYAAIAVTIIPTLVLYFILNKSVIEGMAAGAVKG
jgi:raffinose/stachyose/melibiose transport system permease protein